MKSTWGWQPGRTEGIWRYGPLWLKPFAAAVPYLTVIILLVMFWLVSGSYSLTGGLLFDLPESGVAEAEASELVALVMPVKQDTLVFFDDSRYSMDDDFSRAAFGTHLAERLARVESKTLTVLADRRVTGGEIARIASLARVSGALRVFFATRHDRENAE